MASGAPSTTANTGVPLVDDWLADTGSGDNVAATALVDCMDFYSETAPVEPEFADGVPASLAAAVPGPHAR